MNGDSQREFQDDSPSGSFDTGADAADNTVSGQADLKDVGDRASVSLGNRTPILSVEQIAELPQRVAPVKFFVALLGHEDESTVRALRMLEVAFGSIDFVGESHLFDATDYYVPEMGSGLSRRIYGFELLMPSESLVAAKLTAVDFERELACQGKRSVNLDIGYLDHAKVVLASLKGAGQKLHLGLGVWADFVGRWQAGKYQPFEWTFPDFKSGRYDSELARMRGLLLEQLRELQQSKA